MARENVRELAAVSAEERDGSMIENVKCPTCDGPMTSRKNNSTGQRFWGCNAYPKCKGTRNTDGEAPRQRDFDANDATDTFAPSDRQRNNDRGRWRHS